MKKVFLISALALQLVFADEKEEKKEKHDHDHGEAADHAAHDHDDGKHDHVIKAPNGGRILHGIEPHAEFFITKERKVQITFVDDNGKAQEDGATLRAIGGKLSAPTKFTFKKTEHGLISEQNLPEGKLVPIILMFKDAEGKKVPVIRFNVDLNDCPTCDFLEYACTCDHEGHDHAKEGGKDHAHKE